MAGSHSDKTSWTEPRRRGGGALVLGIVNGPVFTRQIEASDLAWPLQKAAERKEAASAIIPVRMGFQRVGRGAKASDVSTDLDLLHLEPIFACYSLTSSHRSVLNLDSCYVEVEPTFLDSRPLVVLNGVSLPDGAGIRSVFVDEADEFLIRRIVVGSRDAMQCQTDLFYKKSESGDSVVSGWKISKFGEDGAVISTVESVVTNAEFNLSLDRSEFTIDFPAGTYVNNLEGPQDYIVRSDGSKRLVAGSENDKSYEELLKSP
jgi:hypothetical protein